MRMMYVKILLLLNAIVIGTSCCDDNSSSLWPLVMSVETIKRSPVIIYDSSNDHMLQIVDVLIQNNRPMMMCDYRGFYTLFKQLMKKLLEDMSLPDTENQLNVLVICQKDCIMNTLNHATNLDNALGQRSLLRHFTSWLIISPHSPTHLNVNLDHVAWVTVTKMEPLSSNLPDNMQNFTGTMFRQPFNLCISEVHTLLWMPLGREWSFVDLCDFGDDYLLKLIFPNKLRGLNGRQLVIATLEWLYFAKRKVIDGKIKYVGSGFDVVDILARKFNFSYETVEPEDMSWGQELEIGSWTGVTGMVQRAEADFCPVPYGMSLGRKKALGFTSIVHSSAFSALYKIPGDDANDWLYFLSCFSWHVIVCGLISLLWIVLLVGCIYCKQTTSKTTSEGMAVCFEIALNIPFHQGIIRLPHVTSSRILVCTWCLFCMIMTAVYTGNLIAFSAVAKQERPFKTVQQLAEQNKYVIGMLEGAYAANVLKRSNDTVFKNLYRKAVEPIKSANSDEMISEAVHRLLEGDFVLLASTPVKDAILSVTCDVVKMEEELFPLHSVYIFPRKSPLLKYFDSSIMLLWDHGLLGRLEKEQTPKSRNCTTPLQRPRFRLTKLKTVFLTCSSGILVAVVVLLVEILKKKNNPS